MSIRKSEYRRGVASKMKQLFYLSCSVRVKAWVAQVISYGGIDEGNSNTSFSV